MVEWIAMAKQPKDDARELAQVATSKPRNAVGAARTRTTPDTQKGGPFEGANLVTGLLLYRTDTTYFLPKTVRRITMGSDPDMNILVASPFVSGLHCLLERKGEKLIVVDKHSKNGTYFEGERERRFTIKPGRMFIVGARPHCYIALNDEMRQRYSALTDILGTHEEHAIGGLEGTPTPSDVIIAAVQGAHMLITSEPHCEQDALARIIHEISLLRMRDRVELDGRRVPAGKAQAELIKKASRSTLVLDLGDDGERLDPTFVSTVFSSRRQIRVIVLARTADVAASALGQQYTGVMQHIWLRPVASRPEAIHRLLNHVFREHNSPLQVARLTPNNQEALREYHWPHNFLSLREAAERLTAIHRLGFVNLAAAALELAPSTLYHWYSHQLKLEHPLAFDEHKRAVVE